MKKTVALVLALLLVISPLGGNMMLAKAAGEPTITFTVSSDSVSPNGIANITVTMSGNTGNGISSLGLALTYDNTQLELGTPTATVPNLPLDSYAQSGTATQVFSFGTDTVLCTANNIVILTIPITVKGDATAGVKPLTLSSPTTIGGAWDNITGGGATQYPLDLKSGKIDVIKPLASAVAVTLSAPVMGATPEPTVSGTGYTGTVSWSPALTDATSFKFAPNTAYTATVTLSPTDTVHSPFANPSTVTINGDTPTSVTTNSATSIVFTKTFPATANKTDVSDKITFNGATFTYNRAAQALTDAVIDSSVTGGSFTYTGDNPSQTNAGDYTTMAVYDSPTAHGEKTVSWKINPASLTVSSATATSRTYDKTMSVGITGASLVGLLDGDTVGIALIGGTVATADAGQDKDVTVSVTLDGASKDNYSVTAPTGVKVTISPAEPSYSVPAVKNIKVDSALGVFTAAAPNSGTGIGSETVAGSVAWYSDNGYSTPAADGDVSGKTVSQSVILYWEFTPTSGNYAAKQGSTTFTIVAGDPQPMAFTSASISKTFGDTAFTNAASHTASANDAANGGISTRGAITYSSSDLSVATVDSSTGAVAIAGAGSATITATAAAVSGKWAEDTATYTLTVGQKAPALSDLTFDLTGVIYSGNPQGVSAPTTSAAGFGAITVKYNGNDTVPTNAATYAVTAVIEEGTNYTAATLTLGNYTISPKQTSITGATLAAKTYDGTMGGTVDAVTFSDTPADYTAAAQFTTASAGTAKPVTVTVTLNDANYTLASATYATTAAIGQAATTGVPKTLQVVKNHANNYSFNLTTLLPNLTTPLELGTVSYTVSTVTDGSGILTTTPNGSVTSPLTVSVASTNLDTTATITLNVTSTNYADFTAVITVQTVDKYPVAIGGVTLANKTYDAAPYSYTATPTLTNTVSNDAVNGITLEALYESTDSAGYSSATAPTNAGAYKLTLSVPATNPTYTGNEDFAFTITPKAVAVTADNKTIIVGGALPSYTYTQSPAALLGTDTWTTLPTVYCPTADANTINTYPIVVTSGTLSANYSVTYVNGTLTVSANNDANLSALSLDNGTLVPDFSPDVVAYTVSVANSVNSVTVTAVASDAGASISGAGTHSLSVGSNTIDVTVTAQDNTTKTYKITVTRAGNVNFPSTDTTPTPSTPDTTSPEATPTPENPGYEIKDGNGNTIKPDERGNITVPSGGAAVDVDNGTKIDVPAGSVISGNGAITIGSGGAQVTLPSGATLKVEEDTVIIIDGDTPLGYYVSFSNPFTDVKSGDWFYDDVAFAVAHGLFKGTGDDAYSPNRAMTRAMWITVLARLDGQDTSGGATWYEKALAWGKASGISDGSNPDNNITREQIVTMLYRYAGSPAVNSAVAGFGDAEAISDYAKDALAWAISVGIVKGDDKGNVNPQGNATRAEVAAILHRFIDSAK